MGNEVSGCHLLHPHPLIESESLHVLEQIRIYPPQTPPTKLHVLCVQIASGKKKKNVMNHRDPILWHHLVLRKYFSESV